MALTPHYLPLKPLCFPPPPPLSQDQSFNMVKAKQFYFQFFSFFPVLFVYPVRILLFLLHMY